MKKCYIISSALISDQLPFSDDWMGAPLRYPDVFAPALDPDFKAFISPSESRRMSRILKRAVCSALSATGGRKDFDAIIMGTGAGCIENSEKFLFDMVRMGEACLKPTLFMQSTHNTIASQIAILMGCHGYNMTYTQDGVSFESALLDGFMQISEGDADSVLVGSHDEATPLYAEALRRNHPRWGLVSEVSLSMVLSSVPREGCCSVEWVKILNEPTEKELRAAVLGERADVIVSEKYKEIFGQGYSASAVGVYVGMKILEYQRVPSYMAVSGQEGTPLRDVLILNRAGAQCAITKLHRDV